MRAIRENELAAEALGVDTRRVKVIAFTISAVIGALGGAIYASGYLYISPDSFNFDHAVAFLAMVLVGEPNPRWARSWARAPHLSARVAARPATDLP